MLVTDQCEGRPPGRFARTWLVQQERRHAGCCHDSDRLGFFRAVDRLCTGVQSALRRALMFIDYLLGGIVSAGILVYLTYALLRPERF